MKKFVFATYETWKRMSLQTSGSTEIYIVHSLWFTHSGSRPIHSLSRERSFFESMASSHSFAKRSYQNVFIGSNDFHGFADTSYIGFAGYQIQCHRWREFVFDDDRNRIQSGYGKDISRIKSQCGNGHLDESRQQNPPIWFRPGASAFLCTLFWVVLHCVTLPSYYAFRKLTGAPGWHGSTPAKTDGLSSMTSSDLIGSRGLLFADSLAGANCFVCCNRWNWHVLSVSWLGNSSSRSGQLSGGDR